MTVALSIRIWDGCAPEVAEALRVFSAEWGPYSTASRRYSIYGLVDEKIEPAWRAYVIRLGKSHKGHAACISLSLTDARRSGFRALEEHIIAIYRNALPWKVERVSLKSLLTRADENQDVLSSADMEFAATLGSLRELVVRCRTKQPKKRSAGRLNARRARPLCQLCGRATELAEYLQFTSHERDKFWPSVSNDRQLPRLSGRYCSSHRPKLADGKQNPIYQRDRRRRERFDEELKRLSRQAATPSRLRGATGKREADLFIQALAARRAYYPDEEPKLRDEAHNLVKYKITDRKKEILALRAVGMTQSAIALKLKISPQAVSKALKSIPAAYRVALQG